MTSCIYTTNFSSHDGWSSWLEKLLRAGAVRLQSCRFGSCRYEAFDVLAKDGDATLVLAALWNNEVGMALGGLDELLVHGLEHCQIAIDDHGNGTSAVDGVALNVADEALVGVGVDEYLQVHHVAQTLVDERHDDLDDDHWLRLHMDGLRQSV